MSANIKGAIENMNGQLGQVANVLAQLQSQMSAMSAENAALRAELAETRNIALSAQASQAQATTTGLTTPERQSLYGQSGGIGASVHATTHPDVEGDDGSKPHKNVHQRNRHTTERK